MQNIKHLFFDFDNTLWDFEANSEEALSELFYKYEIEKKCKVSFLDFLITYKEINHNLWHLYSTNKATKEEIRFERFNNVFKFYNYENNDLAEIWDEEYLTISPFKTKLVTGAIEILEYLKPKYQLHIITNGFKEVQETKLINCDLKKYFNQIIISEIYGFNKPDINIFKMAEILAETNHTECAMIGDNFDTDITGAINANWKSFYLSATNSKIGLDYISIKQLLDLKKWL